MEKRQTQTLTLVLQDTDDAPVIVPFEQDIEFAQWEDGRVPYNMVLASTGTAPTDTTGGALILTVRFNWWDPLALIARQATTSSPASANGYFAIGAIDNALDVSCTALMSFSIDSTGKRWQQSLAVNVQRYRVGKFADGFSDATCRRTTTWTGSPVGNSKYNYLPVRVSSEITSCSIRRWHSPTMHLVFAR